MWSKLRALIKKGREERISYIGFCISAAVASQVRNRKNYSAVQCKPMHPQCVRNAAFPRCKSLGPFQTIRECNCT